MFVKIPANLDENKSAVCWMFDVPSILGVQDFLT